MKNINWAEKIGLILMVFGFVFLILNDTWENNPIPQIMERNMMISSAGLLIWAIGHIKREADEKKKE
jgi:vacuolar-type H+-ATPase subunit I/STV1